MAQQEVCINEAPQKTITQLQYLQLLGLFVLAERAVRQIDEIRVSAVALLGGPDATGRLVDDLPPESSGNMLEIP